MHVKLLHTSKNLFLQFLLTSIPGERQRTAPPFKVIHLPPSQEGRACDKLAHLLFCIPQLEQHITPYALLANDSQGQVHPMQGEPVDFLFPTLPVPESHRVREGAVVESITLRQAGLMPLSLLHRW